MNEPQTALTHAPEANAAVQTEPHQSPFSIFIPKSMMGRLLAAILLAAMLPTLIVGWLGYTTIYSNSKKDKMHDVGMVADLRHSQLIFFLNGATSRAGQFLEINLERCNALFGRSSAQTESCLRSALTIFVAREAAAGATLHRPGAGDLTVGIPAAGNPDSWQLQPGQLAVFPLAPNQSDRVYHVPVTDPQTRSKLVMTYPVGLLQDIFVPQSALGHSGETFLADRNGLFITQPRYPSVQGHGMAISAVPMQACLQQKTMEMLELDYRDVPIIHGFRYIPEIGGGCIMAHFDQQEAFAPLEALKRKLIAIALAFGLLAVMLAFYLARNIVKPVRNFTKVTRAITAGDYQVRADVTGVNEIADLAASFNLMTHRLVQSERTLNEAQQLVHIGSWERDLITNSFLCSEEIFRILEIDLAHGGISYETFILTVHPEDREMVDRAYMTCIRTREPFDIVHRLLLANGRVKWVNEHGTFYYDSNGIPLRSVGTIQDITERKHTDDILRISATAFETHEGITITDVQANIIRVNQAFQNITGYSQEEVLGKNLRILSSGRQDKAFYAAMWQQLLDNGSWSGEIWNKRKSGQIYPEWLTITAVKNEQGATTEYVGIFSDITTRKEAEEEQAKYNEELKALNHQLQDTQSMLLQSEKMSSIGQLAAGVAHEINNPIGYVYSNLGTLEKYVQDTFGMIDLYEQAEEAITDAGVRSKLKAAKDKLDIGFLKEDLRALMNESRDGITRVKQIVQNLKDFSHVDASDEWHFADLHKGLDSTLNIVNNEIKYKAEVVREYGELPEIECMPSQLNQVFMNLLVNASHAIEERGTITIRTGATHNGQQGGEVWVEVADTGKGIAPEHLKKIFDPFFTTKPVGKGTGLGLSLSYGIIQKHHGRIEVHSEVGKGTTFRVCLPVKRPQVEEARP